MGYRVRIAGLLTSLTLCIVGAAFSPPSALGQQTNIDTADRMFVVALHQANLWIMPVSRQAPNQTTNEGIRKAAREIFDAHSRLDVDILKAAADAGIVLPNEPNSDQKARIVELSDKIGSDHDRTFATTVRAAESSLLVQASRIRALTKNSTMRTLAHVTMHGMMRNMTSLEATGLVDPKAFQLDGKKAEVSAVRIIADNVEPADRELYVQLRQYSLWQTPISREAADRAADARVRNVSGRLADEHTVLSQKIYDFAQRAGVVLPAEPTTEQKSWANAISKSSGPELDRMFANLLRAADGSLITLVAESRATSRNDAVRELAQGSLEQLLGHMTLLESTGLVQSTSLTVSPETPATETRATGPSPAPTSSSGRSGLLTGVIVLIVAAAGTLWLVRAVGHHGGSKHRR
ncbi:DUF4142 domain-containing protein [Lentzea tibetensis]|nr:DUF4142 domain-containing protein [Lentzea tibetensis]